MTTFSRLALAEVIEITPPRYGDARGSFSEVFKRPLFEANGVAGDWLQENQSHSANAGTIRGLHFQAPPAAQAKLVRVLRGVVFDVVVDIRLGSPTYGQWVGCELSSEKGNQLFIPAGFAHAFQTLVDDVDVAYRVDALYAPQCEGAIRWDDPDIGIAWRPIAGDPILSAKDAVAPYLSTFQSPFRYEGQ
ncbi:MULTISPECIES: dTDP-4-dehydrorhamnose 3,5-epimerase [Sphingomonas]|uniref:dTDP-4-dehydrorhamnose 3,5-epimerase n=1 Tax=Sphingomonas TaxID=13687 RepID=UPI000832F495|nr:dTDP-4-dehydrorhamnose 3,5-epimerase [Sphingomonas sp. CCH10-B3]